MTGPPSKIIDLHVHIADLNKAREHSCGFFRWSGRIIENLILKSFYAQGGETTSSLSNETWFPALENWVTQSSLDQVVLLALDGVYDKSGSYSADKTCLKVENSFVASVAKQSSRFLFGASIHPYRRDAITALDKVIRDGACLIKWIPSSQQIKPDDPRCLTFYEAMAHHNIPLLTHTGVEHVLGGRRSSYNHPDRLVPALKMGVNVIAAHCGTNLFLHECSYFSQWAALARKYPNMYGDLAAFPVMTRIPALRKILASEKLLASIIYGSDYPAFSSPVWCWQLGLKKINKLRKISNPLERNVQVMKALGVPETVFLRSHLILKL